MNYAKIQDILEKDGRFGPSVAERDTTVQTRNGEGMFAALTVKVAQAIEKLGMNDKACSRVMVLGFAARLSGNTPTPPPVKPKPAEHLNTVVVKAAPTAEVQPSPTKVQQVAQQIDLAKFLERGDITRFQSAVAIGQLLAAVFQLAENDSWEGSERRKELLNELLESYEVVAKKHVNFSVKQIIRAKAEEQFRTP